MHYLGKVECFYNSL